MNDYRLKMILVILSAVVFSMIFLIIALVAPVKDAPMEFDSGKASNKLEEVSKSLRP